jgi:putative membrane protein
MTHETEEWLRAMHLTGDFLWIAGLTAVLGLLQLIPRVEEKSRDALLRVGMRLGIVMDVGATLAIGMGLWLAFGRTPNAFATGGWLHVKLTAVVVGVLSTHGIARMKLKKFRKGDVRPLPPVVWILFGAGVLAAIILGSNDTLMRK